MTLCWGDDGYGFSSKKDDNAVARVERVFPSVYKLTMRVDVNDTTVQLLNSPCYVVGEYPTHEEARAMAYVIYRLQANVITS